MVGGYLTLVLITRSEPLVTLAGAAVGLSLLPVLTARRSTRAIGAAFAVFLVSFGTHVWLTMLVGVVTPLAIWVFGHAVSGPQRVWLELALIAAYYSLLLGIATQSWKVALAILACGAASIMVDYALPRMEAGPSYSFLCVGVVIIPAIDTLARAGRSFNPHACPRCNYDLSGLHSPTCPECGNTIPTSPPLSGPAT